jgi:hypothetical protein
MIEIILCIYLAYKNSLIAKVKGLSSRLWAVLTVVAALTGEAIAYGIIYNAFYNGPKVWDTFFASLTTHPIHLIFVAFCGIGGCLFIRYLLEQKPGNVQPEAYQDEETEIEE